MTLTSANHASVIQKQGNTGKARITRHNGIWNVHNHPREEASEIETRYTLLQKFAVLGNSLCKHSWWNLNVF